MAETMKVIIDAGHGGADPGATYYGRQEKIDNLKLALAVGAILSRQGVDVVYTRVNDTYNTPFEKAQMGNHSGADYFISIHRNAMPVPGTASGVETLVYENSGVPALLAQNINSALSDTGFTNLGINERPGLVVLRRTEMPAVLVEAGFIDNEADNRLFDQSFPAIAQRHSHHHPPRRTIPPRILPSSNRSIPKPTNRPTTSKPTNHPRLPRIHDLRQRSIQSTSRRIPKHG